MELIQEIHQGADGSINIKNNFNTVKLEAILVLAKSLENLTKSLNSCNTQTNITNCIISSQGTAVTVNQ